MFLNHKQLASPINQAAFFDRLKQLVDNVKGDSILGQYDPFNPNPDSVRQIFGLIDSLNKQTGNKDAMEALILLEMVYNKQRIL